jgi:hypothetical protein
MSIEIESGFHWVPAGAFYINHGGLGAYIRYHKYRDTPITIKHLAPLSIWLDCPDRELVLVGDTHHANRVRPTEGTYDEYVSFGFSYQNAFQDFDVDYLMVNYTQSLGKEAMSPRLRRLIPRQPNETRIISDSGGFQLGNNRLEYIDPVALTEWYNDNVDIGLVLDIANIADEDLNRRAALVQQRNTQIILDNKKPTLELMNIMHGSTYKAREEYRAICEHPDIDRLAVADSYVQTLFVSISDFLSILSTGKKYKHYHMLGVLNTLQVTILMRMAHYKFAPLITSDSSTHIQEAVAKGYYLRTHISEGSRHISLGDKTNFPNHHNILPCTCPICRTIHYTDIMGIINSNVTSFLLMMHNLYATQQYIKSLWEVVQGTTTKELKAFMKSHLKSRNGLDETMKCLDFLDSVQTHGVKASRAKYSYYLSNMLVKPETSLFESNPQSVPEEKPFNIEDMIKRYEDRTGRHGRKTKTAPKGHKISKSKSRKAGGVKKKVVKRANDKANPKVNPKGSARPGADGKAGIDNQSSANQNQKSSVTGKGQNTNGRQRKEETKA